MHPYPIDYDPTPKNQIQRREQDWAYFWYGSLGTLSMAATAAITQLPGLLIIGALFFIIAAIFSVRLLTPNLRFKGKVKTGTPDPNDLDRKYNKFLLPRKTHTQRPSTTAANPELQKAVS